MPGQACDLASGWVFNKWDPAVGTVSCVMCSDEAFANRTGRASKGLISIQVRPELRGRRGGNSALKRSSSIWKNTASSFTRDQMSS